MVQVRARRRRGSSAGERASAVGRAVKLAVPAVVVALVTAGALASATPGSSAPSALQPAVSGAPSTSTAPAVRDDGLERTTRLLSSGRPALSTASAAQRAAALKKAKADAAEAKIAKDKAAKAEAKAKAKAKAKAAKAKAKAAKAKAKAAKAKARAAEKKAERAAARKRAAARAAVLRAAVARLDVTGKRYTRVEVNVRTQPRNSAKRVGEIARGKAVSITGTREGSWTLVSFRGQGRWVHTAYLTKSKPKPKAKAKSSSSSSTSSGGGMSMRKCASGSKMERGLTRDAVKVHRAICARWPQIKSFGGMRADSDSFHSSGRAVDVMIPNASVGRSISRWVRANRKQLGVSEVIYAQHIWTVQRSGEGWRSMSDRGNRTANHYDHVHVSVYGNRATG